MSLNCKPLKIKLMSESVIRNKCLQIVESKFFENFILIIIFINLTVLTLYWVNVPATIINVMEIINYIFVVIFTFESILKIGAYGYYYFYSGWNVFDFLIVIGAWASLFLKIFTSVTVLATTTVIRTFRICRVFRLIKRAKQLNAIFNAIIITLPALGNLGCLLLLFIYLFAVMGINLFATL